MNRVEKIVCFIEVPPLSNTSDMIVSGFNLMGAFRVNVHKNYYLIRSK